MKRQLLFLQIMGWVLAFFIFYVYLRSRLEDPDYVLAISISSFLSFILIIYGYAFFIFPKYYSRTSKATFISIVLVFYTLVLGARILSEVVFIAPLAESSTIFNMGRTHLLYDVSSTFFALIVGILLVSVFENIAREKREVVLQRKQSETELNLLKAQLQPHFLFNSLNSLYYDVYKTQPDVASRISMLSDIMRYFMDQSPQEKILLEKEMEFIRSYIELERVRLVYQPVIELQVLVSENIMIPPMLLIPLVENIFKHGLNNKSKSNFVSLTLQQQGNELIFTVKNPAINNGRREERIGVGLRNLRERLLLLYKDRFTLKTETVEDVYLAQLIIPIS